ncbi:MAG: hypothetical protein Q8N17_09985 [Burkholderiaceae bacterium]|nr:hypothetical protein [Burkholderiaceae bacterium]
MSFFYRNIYTSVLESKFSIPSNLISNKYLFEIKFEGIENLDDEAVLKSLYLLVLLSGKAGTFKNFTSKYHLGKTFYDFKIFLTFSGPSVSHFVEFFFELNLVEPNKINFRSSFNKYIYSLTLLDPKSLLVVESNPHFFK